MTHTHLFNNPRLQILTGALLVIVSWFFSWQPELNGESETIRILFFPLWLGYILVIDYLVWWRKGTSLLRRNWRAFLMLFVLSAPAWWFFEFLNTFTNNWIYLGKERFTDIEYAVLATVAFSTVIPAVFATAELASTFKWVREWSGGPVIRPTPRILNMFLATGIVMLAGIVLLPDNFFPCLWVAPYLILESINARLGYRSLFDYTKNGNWKPIVALGVGTLICGFFWELWNYYSYPKWIYHVPFVDFLHIFEMPILGYGGYIPFGFELFAMYHLVVGLTGYKRLNDYIEID
jgi:hypothetical protein